MYIYICLSYVYKNAYKIRFLWELISKTFASDAALWAVRLGVRLHLAVGPCDVPQRGRCQGLQPASGWMHEFSPENS